MKKISKYFSFKIWVFFLYLYREPIFKRKSVQSLKMAIRCFISKGIWIINKVCTISAYKYLHIQSLSEIVEGIIRIQYKLEMSVSSASIYPLPVWYSTFQRAVTLNSFKKGIERHKICELSSIIYFGASSYSHIKCRNSFACSHSLP